MKLAKAIEWYEKAQYNWARDKGHYEKCIRDIGMLTVAAHECDNVDEYKVYDRKINRLTREAVGSKKSADSWFEVCKRIEQRYDVLN